MLDLLGILKLLWIPFIGISGWFFRGLSEKYQNLNDRLIRLESTAITRESLEAILDKKFEKFTELFDKSEKQTSDILKDIKQDLKDLKNKNGN